MNKEQAIANLIQVAHLAQKGGLLNLQDAVAVAQSIAMLEVKEEEKVEEKPKK